MRKHYPARTLSVLFVALLFAVTAIPPTSSAQGLKVPRFASLRAGEVNMRSGPGSRYPIEWVYVRRYLPMEIIDEFEAWRKVRDWKGVIGWVHKSMLTGRRSIVVTGTEQKLYRSGSEQSKVIARVERRVVGRLIKCPDAWCEVEIAGMRGWMKPSQFWGTHPGEILE